MGMPADGLRGSAARGSLAVALAMVWLGLAIATATAHATPNVYVADASSAGQRPGVTQFDGPFSGLTPLSPAKAGVPPVQDGGPLLPRAVVASPDGRSVYVAVQIDTFDGGGDVLQYSVGADGTLTPKTPARVLAASSALGDPSSMVMSPDGRNVYVAQASGGIEQFSVGDDGVLAPLPNAAVGTGYYQYDMAISPNGRSVYVGHSEPFLQSDARVNRFSRGADGELTFASHFRLGCCYARGMTVTADSRAMYVAHQASGINLLTLGADGNVVRDRVVARSLTAPGGGSNGQQLDVAIRPGGDTAYVTTESGRLEQYAIGADGSFTSLSPAVVSGPEANPTAIAASPDGRSLYVTHDDGRLAQFAIAADGRLTAKTPAIVAGGDEPVDIAAGPDPVAARPTATIATPRDGATYRAGSTVSSDFSCFEGQGGPGTSSCLDEDGHPSGTPIDTATPGTHSFVVTAVSANGQSSTATVSYTVIANQPPVALDQAVTTNQNTPVAVTLRATDADGDALVYAAAQPSHGTVGCTGSACTYRPATDYAGPDAFTFTVSDGHGGTDDGRVDVTVVDGVAPQTMITSGPASPANDPTPTFGFTSTEAGSTFECRVDDGPFADCTSPETTAAVADGAHTFEVRATDPAHNTDASPASRAFTVDTTAPAVRCASADGEWHPGNVSIACTAADAGSGLANAGDASFSLSTSVVAGSETAHAATDSRQVCDMVDNCAAAGPVGDIRVDRKAPSITFTTPGAGARYSVLATLLSPVKASYSCSDAGSGVASCAGTQPNGATVDTGPFALGSHTFTVQAIDRVGNTTSVTHAYTVGL